MSVYKPLLILANLIAADQSLAPPTSTPNPNTHEASKYGGRDLFNFQYVKTVPKLFRAGFWAAGLGEIGLIAASHFPDHPIMQKLLSLVPNPSGASSISITRQYLIGTAFMISSGIIRRAAYRAMGRMFTFSLTIRDDHRLVTDGPYAYVRHPAYTGLVLHYIGTVLMCFAAGTFVKTCGIMENTLGRGIVYGGAVAYGLHYAGVISRINIEDNVLKGQFGAQWDKWARQVPYKFLPLIF